MESVARLPANLALLSAGLALVLLPALASATELPLPPSISFSSTSLSAKTLEPKSLVLSVFNPAQNGAELQVGVLLKLPSGLHIASSDFAATGSNQMAGQFRVRPGEQRQVEIGVWAEEPGSRMVEAQVTYRAVGPNATLRTLQHTIGFNVEPGAPAPPPQATQAAGTGWPPLPLSIDLRPTSWQFWLLAGVAVLLLVVILRR